VSNTGVSEFLTSESNTGVCEPRRNIKWLGDSEFWDTSGHNGTHDAPCIVHAVTPRN